MGTFSITATLHSIPIDAHLDNLARTADPFLRKKLTDEVKRLLQTGKPRDFHYTLTGDELNRYSRAYGEQYAADASADLNQYFDIVNGRLFSRSVPTQLAVLYLFGSGRQYRPNVGALSAAGEGVSGYCMEKFGFTLLVRPLGIMPDAVLWANRGGQTVIALTEAKASSQSSPVKLVEKHVFDFFVDIKTRASGFRNVYEAYLVCSQFQDGGKIACSCLHLDLRYYIRTPPAVPLYISTSVPSLDSPSDRLRAIIRLQAEICETEDKYLAGILSEEATRTATLDLLKKNAAPQEAAEVERHVWNVAAELHLTESWQRGQQMVRETKEKEQEAVSQAIQKYQKPSVELPE